MSKKFAQLLPVLPRRCVDLKRSDWEEDSNRRSCRVCVPTRGCVLNEAYYCHGMGTLCVIRYQNCSYRLVFMANRLRVAELNSIPDYNDFTRLASRWKMGKAAWE